MAFTLPFGRLQLLCRVNRGHFASTGRSLGGKLRCLLSARTHAGGVRYLRAVGIRAMPSARALLVASLLTEPPYGCLGPSGNDRYRKRSLRSQTEWGFASQLPSRAGFFAMNRPPADAFGQALLEDPPQ